MSKLDPFYIIMPAGLIASCAGVLSILFVLKTDMSSVAQFMLIFPMVLLLIPFIISFTLYVKGKLK